MNHRSPETPGILEAVLPWSRRGFTLGIMVLLGVAACASAGGEQRERRSSDILTAQEIQDAGERLRTALEAVEHLRPHFLRTRPAGTIAGRPADPVRVYVDGSLWGDPRSLAQLPVEEVERIRYIRPSDAQTRFGLDHSSGAIEVTRRRN